MTVLAPLAIQKFFDGNGDPLVNGQLFTYQAVTTTKVATWQDSAGVSLNSNPIRLDYRGECRLWLDPSLTYKFVLAPATDTDPPTKPIWTVDNIQGALTAGSASQQIIGQILYPKTPAETLAGVTIVNWFYPPMYVDRYGTNTTPGTTSMRAAWQAAIDTARLGGGTIRYGATAPYLIDGELDCTVPVGGTTYGYTFLGESNVFAVTTNAPYRPPVIFKHTGTCFDCTGALGINFSNLSFGTDVTTYPQYLFLLARNSDKRGQLINMDCVQVYGKFSKAVVYNYGSEDDQYTACQMYNVATDNGAKVICWTTNNIKGATSNFTTIATGPVSCIDHKVVGGEYMLQSSAALADVFDIENVEDVKIDLPWARSALDGVGNGRSIVHIDLTNGPSNSIVLTGITGEHSTHVQNYGVFIDNVARTPARLHITGCRFPNGIAMVSAGALVTCDSFYIRDVTNASVGGGLVFSGTLQNSHIDELATNVSIGTDTNNVLNVSINNLTVTTKGGGSFWAGSSTQNWTPGLGAFTLAGPGATSNTTVHYHGRQVTVEAVFTGYTTFSIAPGGAMTGLPVPGAIGAGEVIVMNLTTPALIGMGKVSGTTLIMPNIVAGANQVGIRATYFFAT